MTVSMTKCLTVRFLPCRPREDVFIFPDTSTSDVLRHSGLDPERYQLCNSRDPSIVYDLNDLIFARVSDAELVCASVLIGRGF